MCTKGNKKHVFLRKLSSLDSILYIIIIIIILISVLPKSRSFTANSGTKAALLPKDRSSTANPGTKVAVLLGINKCGSFPLLSAPLSLALASEQRLKDLKRSQGGPTWR